MYSRSLIHNISTIVPFSGIEIATTEKALEEIKQILDNLGVTLFLRKGTYPGVIRDNELIPWDDDVDIGSVVGYNG